MLSDKNLYAYCDNNPIMRTDKGGTAWETVFDIISLGLSIGNAMENYDDPMAWVGLAGDVIDLIPFVTGVGETARVVNTGRKIADAADDAYDTSKALKKGWNVGDDITSLTKSGNKPSWSTVKSRYWKNEAFFNASEYSMDNLSRMRKGLAPQVELNGKLYAMELHHINPRRLGGTDAFDNLAKLTPWDHSKIDIFRHFIP